MKTKIKSMIIAAVLSIFILHFPTKLNAQSASVSFQVFYDDLDPYGQWVSYPSYGYVWVPAAGPDFMPYSTGGHWIWTEYGWTWASDYSWGWAPFHYGRWDYVDYYGWIWVPGNEWGPAWVGWRSSPGYYGWAPLTPGISLSVAIGSYNAPANYWVVVDHQHMGRSDIHHYYGPRKNNQVFINNSTVINNTYVDNSRNTTYVSGPKSADVQKHTGRPVKQIGIREKDKPGQSVQNNEMNIYRPRVSGSVNQAAKPTRVADKNEVKPPAERKQNINSPQRPDMNKMRKQGEKEKDTPSPKGQQQDQQKTPAKKPSPQMPNQKREDKATPPDNTNQQKDRPHDNPDITPTSPKKPQPQREPQKQVPRNEPQQQPAPQHQGKQNPNVPRTPTPRSSEQKAPARQPIPLPSKPAPKQQPPHKERK